MRDLKGYWHCYGDYLPITLTSSWVLLYYHSLPNGYMKENKKLEIQSTPIIQQKIIIFFQKNIISDSLFSFNFAITKLKCQNKKLKCEINKLFSENNFVKRHFILISYKQL